MEHDHGPNCFCGVMERCVTSEAKKAVRIGVPGSLEWHEAMEKAILAVTWTEHSHKYEGRGFSARTVCARFLRDFRRHNRKARQDYILLQATGVI